jgi:RNA polymerase sigma-70 factor (ECF subfamily)
MDEFSTASLSDLIARSQAGESGALDAPIRRTADRLGQFARQMFGAYPRVPGKVDVESLVHEASVRLTESLLRETPDSPREFYGVAAAHMRRELLELAHSGQRNPKETQGPDSSLRTMDSAEIDCWAELHQAAEELSGELQEVFSCLFYHGWKQGLTAKLLGISTGEVRRSWAEACLVLKAAVGSLPAR